ncbi:hypothetical protein [Plastoroseomonas arctica]|uniref:Uncharacterized protein n=1 Tax=Plastoroseomonas arctica TaxID=1509237 RepID=A0AAF1KLA5_9PROT|nr:hypothetical protein [Plastoroseomonas arctica]MBR0654521.1 hypothetical protein [Plastoroseomonas arctica]
MPAETDQAQAIDRATALAREIGPEVGAILLTHYADAETLDTLRPGGLALGTVAAVNRAVAETMAEYGVEVFVQRADRAAFRRWMQEREDTPENRLAWIARDGLLRGTDARGVLGLPPAPPPRRAALGKPPGPAADRLVRAFETEDDAAFDAQAEVILAEGREDILTLVLRKTASEIGDDAAEDISDAMRAAGEGARLGPSGWAELVALPVALPHGAPPDAGAIGGALLASGLVEAEAEIRFAPGWRSPEALAALSPVAMRRTLLDLLDGREPRDLPRGDTDAMAREGFGLLLGLRIDWDIPVWEAISAAGGLPPEPDEESDAEETPEEARHAALFDSWRAAIFDAHDGCVPLALVPPSEVAEEIAAFLEDAGEETAALDEIREFVAMARGEAPGEVVVCRIEIIGDDLELSLYTEAGRFLDSLTLEAARLPAPAGDMPRLIEAFVPVVRDTPGR